MKLNKQREHLLEGKWYLNNLLIFQNIIIREEQNNKIGSSRCEYVEKGSFSGSLLFKVFINDILLVIEISEVSNLTNEKTLYSCENYFSIFFQKCDSMMFLCRFKIKSMKAKAGKLQYIALSQIKYLNIT